ncbi:GNAT family N-acetyltransferase [Chishuiella changwenlii]|jgi:RimJ/RimL family protein N-acetyltransferase|uniref:GNAT family N-acetyltransferase n=1 Tax=Chishuiella changwenlii TaxID=1434701 RepID=UPI002FDA377A
MKVICETKNLVLREFFEIDAYELFQMNSDKELMKIVNEKPYKSEEEANFFIENMIKHYQEFGFGLWGVHEKKSGRFVGWGGLRQTKYGAIINIRLKRKFQNKGYGTEVLNVIVDYAKNELKLDKIAAKANANQPETLKLLQKSKLIKSEDNELVYKL